MSAPPPSIRTSRLRLRPFGDEDVAAVATLAGHPDIAATTLRIPHPYEASDARQWIECTRSMHDEGGGVAFAVERIEDEALVGCVSVEFSDAHDHGEMGYWIGRPFWNRGYATEAAGAVLDYVFRVRGLHRVHAHHFKGNPASGRVLRRIGMTREGELREHVRKGGKHLDIVFYGILRREHAPTGAVIDTEGIP